MLWKRRFEIDRNFQVSTAEKVPRQAAEFCTDNWENIIWYLSVQFRISRLTVECIYITEVTEKPAEHREHHCDAGMHTDYKRDEWCLACDAVSGAVFTHGMTSSAGPHT